MNDRSSASHTKPGDNKQHTTQTGGCESIDFSHDLICKDDRPL